MERKKYLLILILLIINISFKEETHFKKIIYDAFVNDKMDKWREVINSMEKQQSNDTGYLLELISYQYGYTAWCLGNNKKEDAKIFLSLLENNLTKLERKEGKISAYHAFKAAAYGFKIGLSHWRAPFLGPKSMDHAEKALEKDSMCMQANLEMGNIWNHMPEIFGGSKEKALHYYLKALNIIENDDPQIRKNNWIYLNLLVLAGQTEKEIGNKQKALEYYKKTLEIEHGFIWVKNELLPSLLNE
jgi:tetratricopeptide (TPR) repeat protein